MSLIAVGWFSPRTPLSLSLPFSIPFPVLLTGTAVADAVASQLLSEKRFFALSDCFSEYTRDLAISFSRRADQNSVPSVSNFVRKKFHSSAHAAALPRVLRMRISEWPVTKKFGSSPKSSLNSIPRRSRNFQATCQAFFALFAFFFFSHLCSTKLAFFDFDQGRKRIG